MTVHGYIRADLAKEDSDVAATPMNDNDEQDHPAWLELKRMHDRGDFETLERMVRFWKGLEALGMVGGLLKMLVIWVGIVAGGVWAMHTAFGDYIRGFLK
jgi:hypothetical protein